MSTGGGANLGNLGTATVNITADDKELIAKLQAAEQRIKAQVAKNNQEIAKQKPLLGSSDTFTAGAAEIRIRNLGYENERLADKLNRVWWVAEKANKAMADRGASIAAAKAQAAAEKEVAQEAERIARIAAKGTKDAQGGKAGGGNSGYRLLQVGNLIDDLQYVQSQGIRPIVNNIMQIAPQIGIAMIAADQIVKSTVGGWGRLFEMLGDRSIKTAFQQIEARIEVLNNKKLKLQVDYSELDILQKKLETLKQAKETFEGNREDSYTKALAKDAKDFASGIPGAAETLEKHVFETERTEGRTHLDRDAAQKFIDSLGSGPGMSERKKLELLQMEYDKADREFAKEEVGKMLNGDPAAIERMQNRAIKNPGAFNAVDAEGVTAAERLANMPKTREEARRRMQDDAESEARERSEAENLAAWNKAKERRGQAAAEPAKALADIFARDLIKNIRHGGDEHKLDAQVEKHLEAAGVDPDKTGVPMAKMAADVVDTMMKSMQAKIRERALAEGISEGDAAGKIDVEARKAAKAKADKAAGISTFTPEVTSLDSFFQSLLTRKPNEDQATPKIVGAIEETTKATKEIGEAIKGLHKLREARYGP